jgi:hypothetical protein
MSNYSNGKIYTIRNKIDDTKIYVGSTIQPLSVRFGGHKKSSKSEKCKNIKLYIEVNGDWSNWYIELYELFPCGCKEELRKREGEIIRLIGNLNINIAGRDKKEYYEDNKEEIIEKRKEYYNKNSNEISKKSKEYYEDNKEEIIEKRKEYYEDNKEKIIEKSKEYYNKNSNEISKKMKEYYEDNKEKIIEKNKEYYEDNKEKIIEKHKEKFNCCCGGCYTYSRKSTHIKTKKHQEYLKILSKRKQFFFFF